MDKLSGLDVNLSSLVLNSMNFLLFDILLAAAVYYLTADLAGLANSISAIQGKEEPFSFFCPSFMGLGVGITCTKRRVFYILAFFRLVSLSLIFISSMTFTGKTDCVPASSEANVTVLGKFGRHEDFASLERRRLLRESCQGRTNSTIYYGEIRDKNVCELNRSRIPPPIEFDFFSHPEIVNLSACVPEILEESLYKCDNPVNKRVTCRYWTRSPTTKGGCSLFMKTPFTTCIVQGESNNTFSCGTGTDSHLIQNCSVAFRQKYLNLRCQNAIVGCLTTRRFNPCQASINLRNVTHLCHGNGTRFEGVLPFLLNKSWQAGSQDINNLLLYCRKAKRAEWQLDDWLPHNGRDLFSITHAYAAMYASGSERRTVKIQKGKKITSISWLWLATLLLHSTMIIGLGATVLMLRKWKRCQRVANDEVGLGALLYSSTSQRYGFVSSRERAEPQVSGNDLLVEMVAETIRLCTAHRECLS